jgi:hypothetical protein
MNALRDFLSASINAKLNHGPEIRIEVITSFH